MVVKKNSGQSFKIQNQYYYRFQLTTISILIKVINKRNNKYLLRAK